VINIPVDDRLAIKVQQKYQEPGKRKGPKERCFRFAIRMRTDAAQLYSEHDKENSMKYMLLIYNEEKAWAEFSEAQRQGFMGEFMKFTQQIQTSGQWLSSSQLQPTSAATSVRVRDGKRLVTDGPFAETREQLGGYYLIEAKNLDEAIAIAARIPSVSAGTVEVRPLVERPAQATA
jgi:hypothetical protein